MWKTDRITTNSERNRIATPKSVTINLVLSLGASNKEGTMIVVARELPARTVITMGRTRVVDQVVS